MLPYVSRPTENSSSGSEPTSPEPCTQFPSTFSMSSSSVAGTRRRFSQASAPSHPLYSKRKPLRDIFVERMAPIVPSLLILFIGLLFAFHFLSGIAPTTPVSLDLSPMSFAYDTKPARLSHAEIVNELEYWKQAEYARKRLKVYYYDLPAGYNKGLVDESHRNPPKIRDPFCDENFYSAENTIAEFFKNGPIRTYDASEADYFYIPIYTTCYLITNLPNDVNKTGKFFEQAMDIVINEYPYWNRSDGRDHIMMFAQGFGSRLSGDWQRYRHATFLVHNGDYAEEHFDTHKDIVVPPDLSHYFAPVGISSPGQLLPKTNFVLFGGQVLNSSISDHRGSNYSGGVRQYVQANLANSDGYKVTGVRSDTYIQDMMHSVFCLAPHGWHKWSPRPAYAVLLGCIPVVISEQQELFLEDLIDYSKISYWVHPTDIANMDVKLRRIPAAELMEKEGALRDVWRLLWYEKEGLAKEAIMYSLYRKMGASKPHRNYL